MLITMAVGEGNIPESIATSCSVKSKDLYLLPPKLEVTICDLKFANSLSVS
jgi:hypothetical protein